jgi:hypothetical protein
MPAGGCRLVGAGLGVASYRVGHGPLVTDDGQFHWIGYLLTVQHDAISVGLSAVATGTPVVRTRRTCADGSNRAPDYFCGDGNWGRSGGRVGTTIAGRPGTTTIVLALGRGGAGACVGWR